MGHANKDGHCGRSHDAEVPHLSRVPLSPDSRELPRGCDTSYFYLTFPCLAQAFQCLLRDRECSEVYISSSSLDLPRPVLAHRHLCENWRKLFPGVRSSPRGWFGAVSRDQISASTFGLNNVSLCSTQPAPLPRAALSVMIYFTTKAELSLFFSCPTPSSLTAPHTHVLQWHLHQPRLESQISPFNRLVCFSDESLEKSSFPGSVRAEGETDIRERTVRSLETSGGEYQDGKMVQSRMASSLIVTSSARHRSSAP